MTAEKYSLEKIAKELEDTAMGKSFYGNALRVVKDIRKLSVRERSAIDRYEVGNQYPTDRFVLLDLAIKVRFAKLSESPSEISK